MASLEVPHKWINSYVAGDKIYCFTRPTTRKPSASTPADTVSIVANELDHTRPTRHELAAAKA